MFVNIKRVSLLVVLLVVMAGLALTGGCSSDNNPNANQNNGVAQTDLLPGVGPDTVADVVSLASPAVVKISTSITTSSGDPLFNDPFFRQFFGIPLAPRQDEGLGSGFIISKDGYILTNEHVIAGADKIAVTITGIDKDLEAKVVGADSDLDLALLKIDSGADLPFLAMGNSDQIRVGNWVIAIGNPYGLDHTVTTGVISAKGRPISVEDRQYENLIQTDASINPGNSGGPLLNLKGEVVGINTAISAEAQGIGFAIPTSTVQLVLEDLKNNVTKPRPWVGVHVRTLDSELASYLGLDKAEGAVVSGVVAGSPAEHAGLREWDVIVEFNGEKVSKADELVAAIKAAQIGQEANVIVVRQRQQQAITVTVAEKPGNVG
ncbi:MAG: trypsin-like peptidase domain-containing protein [Desulfotomaculaceae bacterium]|nr:trypsin-like peptidase domain-containing protein [Desulfotomaculaceae bacterium]MDD4766554.1 trypsin-like peptidase domain-containing protein [Desulfotomaculaceae bacterium]